jgi:rubrerythrin
VFNALSAQPYGASPYPPTAAPQPRSAASILPAPEFTNTLPETEEETEPIRQWREKQAEEIKRRNAADQEKRDEMANKAEKAIDQFYEDYNKEKEKNIRENKWVLGWCGTTHRRLAKLVVLAFSQLSVIGI